MKTILTIVAAGLSMTGGAVFAAPSDMTTATTEQATAAAQVDTRRYCIEETPTGSRLPRKTCRTRAEWAAKGIDIDNPDK